MQQQVMTEIAGSKIVKGAREAAACARRGMQNMELD